MLRQNVCKRAAAVGAGEKSCVVMEMTRRSECAGTRTDQAGEQSRGARD